ncbi:MAG TPA: MXAN_5187 C-terminal domain-containing protein [Oligoflexia bacterium]|nr:MXAN_5187 C-terminal domain-containing protein [Oligoflexia bacterium]HMP48186.1 MXAN_5187 C-terminal domain-containing protein [Oligoflexia bacterium]
MSNLEEQNTPKTNSRIVQEQLDAFEARLKELKILYEQYFCGLLPFQPEKEHKEVSRLSRELLRSPFRNSQANFRLKNLVARFQTLATYWERVLKQREEGNYHRDKFKSKIRADENRMINRRNSSEGQAEKAVRELFDTYRRALENSGLASSHLTFEKFSADIQGKAKILGADKGKNAVSFRVEIEGGKVSIKARVN